MQILIGFYRTVEPLAELSLIQIAPLCSKLSVCIEQRKEARCERILSGTCFGSGDQIDRDLLQSDIPLRQNIIVRTYIIESRQVPVGNPSMGIASAVLLFILPLVLQQSMILGIAMLHGGSIERRRRNGGRDPMAIEACASATIIGKMMCHQIIYVLPVIYVLHYVPLMFGFPQYGDILHIMCLAVPFIIAVSLMGQTLQAFVNERESVFLLFVFSSVVFVFLTGASWPRYLMSRLWYVVGDCVPATWMSNGYVLMQTNGATLYQVQHHYWMMWLQVPVMFVLAYLVERFVNRRRYRSWIAACESNPKALTRIDMAKNGVG